MKKPVRAKAKNPTKSTKTNKPKKGPKELDKIARENLKLQAVIDKTTQELKQKNRELEIEAALDRVRSRSMAMQKSDELGAVVHLINDQVIRLGIQVDNTLINTDFSVIGNGFNTWIARTEQQYLEKFHIPDNENLIQRKIRLALKKGVEYYIDSYTKAEKDNYYKWLYQHSDLSRVSDERKKSILDAPGLSRATVLSKTPSSHTYVTIG